MKNVILWFSPDAVGVLKVCDVTCSRTISMHKNKSTVHLSTKSLLQQDKEDMQSPQVTSTSVSPFPLHIVTPLLKSSKLSAKIGCSVWLKLENVQTSGSFKSRGLGRLCQKSVKEGCTQFVSSSGGNAGLAAVFCAQELNIPITVVVPEPTPPFIVQKLKDEGATVEVVGKAWDDANVRAMEIAAAPGSVLIHPFDHPEIWSGHSTIVNEIQSQLRGVVPDVIIVAVGGGGLMNGVLEGLHRIGWGDIPLVAMETEGAASLNACAVSGEWKQLDAITSVAKCLGAKRVSERSFQWLSEHKVLSRVVTDHQALSACVRIADDHRILVPPACGAAMAALYGDVLADAQKKGELPEKLENIVAIVCGGNGVNLDSVASWRQQCGL